MTELAREHGFHEPFHDRLMDASTGRTAPKSSSAPGGRSSLPTSRSSSRRGHRGSLTCSAATRPRLAHSVQPSSRR